MAHHFNGSSSGAANNISTTIPDCKLYLGIDELSLNIPALAKAPLVLHVISAGVRQSFPLVIESTSKSERVVTLHPAGTGTSSSASSLSQRMKLWDFADYSGIHNVDFELEKSKFFGMKKQVIATGRVQCRSLLSHQDRASSSTTNDPFYRTTTISMQLENAILSSMHRSETSASEVVAGNHRPSSSSSTSTSMTGKTLSRTGKEFMQRNSHFSTSSAAPTARVDSAEYEPISPTTATTPKVTVTIKYRVIILQRCLQKDAVTIPVSISTPRHATQKPLLSSQSHNTTETVKVSEFHIVAAYAPSPLLIEIMKTLAWRNLLNRALSMVSSHGLVPLHFALLFHNASSVLGRESVLSHQQSCVNNVCELLQRTGKLCFPRLKNNTSCILHAVVRGQHTIALEQLCRFLKKYGPELLVSDTGLLTNQHLSLSTLLEWADEEGYTPLLLACSLPTSPETLIRTLVLAGADVGAVQASTGNNALMCAVMHGNRATVDILLSLMKNPSDISHSPSIPSHTIPNPATAAAAVAEPATATAAATATATATAGNRNDTTDGGVQASPPLPPHPSSTSNSSNDALSRHLRNNLRSRHLLRDAHITSGGFFNRLALYTCNPAQKQQSTGRSVLHLAVIHGQMEIALSLLEIGVPLLDVDLRQEHVFHFLFPSSYLSHSSSSKTYRTNNALFATDSASIHAISWTTRHALMQRLLPYERTRWQTYEQVLQPRSWEFMYRRQIPWLSRNIDGNSPLDLALSLLFSMSKEPVTENEDVRIVIEMISNIVDSLFAEYGIAMRSGDTSHVNIYWLRALQSLLPTLLSSFSSSSQPVVFAGAEWCREWFASTLQEVHKAGSAAVHFEGNGQRIVTETLITSALSLTQTMSHIPLSMVAIAMSRQYHTWLLTNNTSPTTTNNIRSVEDDSSSFAAEAKEENNVHRDSEGNSSNSVCEDVDDVADNADYLFALTALSLRNVTTQL